MRSQTKPRIVAHTDGLRGTDGGEYRANWVNSVELYSTARRYRDGIKYPAMRCKAKPGSGFHINGLRGTDGGEYRANWVNSV